MARKYKTQKSRKVKLEDPYKIAADSIIGSFSAYIVVHSPTFPSTSFWDLTILISGLILFVILIYITISRDISAKKKLRKNALIKRLIINLGVSFIFVMMFTKSANQFYIPMIFTVWFATMPFVIVVDKVLGVK